MDIKNYLPVILRYALAWVGATLATRGYLDGDQSAIFSQNIDVIAGALIGLGSVAYALWKRPSSKGLAAAKAIDKELPKNFPAVIKTPGAAPDIIVSGK